MVLELLRGSVRRVRRAGDVSSERVKVQPDLSVVLRIKDMTGRELSIKKTKKKLNPTSIDRDFIVRTMVLYLRR